MTELDTVVETADTVRCFKLAEVRGQPPRLHPIGRFRSHSYDHVEPVTATCHRRAHTAPAWDCTCGFHAVETVDDLPEVTTVMTDSVLLSVELGGVIIEHDRGVRAEEQAVLGIGFASRCSWCGNSAEVVVPGRRWRPSCRACVRRHRLHSVTRADATAVLGVDVDFVELPPEPHRRWLFGAGRAAFMLVLSTLLTVVTAATASTTAAACTAAFLLGSLALALGTLTSRSIRSHEPLFIGQCACVVLGSVALRLLG